MIIWRDDNLWIVIKYENIDGKYINIYVKYINVKYILYD
jgi:hypothetical protein